MHVKRTRTLSLRRNKRGFALIATLTLMMLLAILATALMATASSQNRIALQTVLQAEARQQALVGLDAAIGELQVELGPDQRVTASSGVTSESEGGTPQHLLGVWDSFDAPIYGKSSKGKIQTTYSQGRSSHFRRWLISSRDRGITHNLKAAGNLCSRKPGQRICLVGEGTLGKSLNARHYVYADLLTMPATGKNKACFAWWVGGENQKAKISVQDRIATTDTMEILHRTWDTPAPMVVDNRALEFMPETVKEPAKLVTLGTLPLMDSSSQAAGAPYFFDVTTTSYTLPINVRNGGLKEDLCLLLNKTSLKGTDFARRHNQDCPLAENSDVPVGTVRNLPIGSWQNLHAYYNCWPDGTADANSNFTARLIGNAQNAYTRMSGSTFDLERGNYHADPNTRTGTTEYDSRSAMEEGSKFSGYARTPVMLAFMNNFGLVTEPKIKDGVQQKTFDGKDSVWKMKMCFAPMFLWWNPYNVPMRIASDKLWARSVPCNTMWLQTYAIQSSGTWNYGWKVYGMKENDGGKEDMDLEGFGRDNGEFFKKNLSGDEEIVFQPGEVLFFSPGKARATQDYSKLQDNPWVVGYNPSAVAGYKSNFYTHPGSKDLSYNSPGVASTTNIDAGRFELGVRFGINASGGAYNPDAWHFAPLRRECITINGGYGGIGPKGQDPNANKYATSPQRMILGWYNPDEISPQQAIICDKNSGAVWSTDGSQSDDTLPYYVASVGVVAKSGNPSVDARMFSDKDYRGKIWQHSSPALWGGLIFNPDEQQRQYHPYQLASLEVGSGLSTSPMDNIGNNGFLGITTDGEQVSFASVLELPVHPPFSLAGFAGMRLQPGWYDGEEYSGGANASYRAPARFRRMQYQSGVPGVGIGNAFADPCLPAGDVYRFYDISPSGGNLGMNEKLFSDFYDHGLLINDSLWDRWFCSSVSDIPTGKGKRVAKEVLSDFLSGKEPLPVSRYKKTSTPYDDNAIIARIMEEDGWKNIAQYLMIDGGFNVNSTSVEAWAAVLQGLAKRKLVSNNGSGMKEVESGKNDNQVLFSRFMLSTTDRSVDSMGGYSMMRGANFRSNSGNSAWGEVRMLEPESIRKLAEEMVKQVRKRGPFLSMSDFINRRLDNAGGEAALKGALQAAIDATDINRDFQEIIVKPQSGNLYSFPDAEKGSMYTAAPGYLIQSDVLASLGNILTVRDDTFTVRAYGCVRNPNNRVLAQAWCEAVVQRTMEYVDPSNAPQDTDKKPDGSAGVGLSNTNKVMGRQFRIVSFKWLDFWDI